MDLVTGAKGVVVAVQHAAMGKSKMNHQPCRDRHGGDRIPGWPCDLDGNGSRVERRGRIDFQLLKALCPCLRSRSRCLPCRPSHKRRQKAVTGCGAERGRLLAHA